MKKTIFVFVLSAICIVTLSFYIYKKDIQEAVSSRDIVLQFITYNGYGNNLFLDNILTGVQKDYDITVTSIVNIPYDTTYSTMISGTDTISPVVSVSNLGRINTPDLVKVFLIVNPGGYVDSVEIPGLAAGQTIEATFEPMYFNIGTGYFFKSYTNFNLDSNQINDTLFQYSISLPGFQRNVLYEEFTSNSSPACANNNTQLNAFVNRNFDSIVAIKYHTGLIGFDLFYNQNPSQQDARMRYYYVVSVPTTFADGKLPVSIPYGDSLNLYNPFYKRLAKGTPFSLTAVDETLSDGSIRSDITVNIISTPPNGSYVLRINAVERYIDTNDAGTNGESQFFDTFRETYPDTNGISIPSSPGTYKYQYTYTVAPEWVDSMIYTAVFIQNNSTREVMNSAKGRTIIAPQVSGNSGNKVYSKGDMLNVKYDFKNAYKRSGYTDSIQSYLDIELFESYFPPLGWEVYNQDGFITYEQFTGANGPTIGGTKSVFMDFYNYYIPGQRDSMYSKTYRNLLSIDTIRFDYSYAQYTSLGTNIDSLTVKVSTDGGITFPFEIFRKGGLALATAQQTTSFFVPQNNTQWRSFKYSLDGIVNVNNNTADVPERFSLMQNYPNPFNPVTVIRYTLSAGSIVSLKIYDVLGKEINTIINERQVAGNYLVEFNADAYGLSSGVYFYRMETEGFTDTKRMILLK